MSNMFAYMAPMLFSLYVRYDVYSGCIYNHWPNIEHLQCTNFGFLELSCIDHENQLLIITNTMNIITFLQPLNFNVFCMITFYSVSI